MNTGIITLKDKRNGEKYEIHMEHTPPISNHPEHPGYWGVSLYNESRKKIAYGTMHNFNSRHLSFDYIFELLMSGGFELTKEEK